MLFRSGDVLVIPDVLVGGWTKSHQVRKGDTLARIARRYRVSVRELERLNRIPDETRLELGQRIVIPRGKRVDPATALGGAGAAAAPAEQWNGRVTVVRPRDSERKTMTVFDSRGRVR